MRTRVENLKQGDRVVFKAGVFAVSTIVNTGNSSLIVFGGLGVRDWPNAKTVKTA